MPLSIQWYDVVNGALDELENDGIIKVTNHVVNDVKDVGMFEENVVLNNDMAEVENEVTNHVVNDFEFDYQGVGDLFDVNNATVEKVDEESTLENEDDSSDGSEDEDFILIEEDKNVDVHVDIEDFKAAVDVDVDESNILSDGDLLDSELDIDDFDSLSEDDDPPLKKVVRKLRSQMRRGKDPISEPFYVGQQLQTKKKPVTL
ncbi:hypothetical protein QVD17_12625 [Tagetes erecta]|uniref:Uncharacterized protein n=1 Tax=Tagetes erecta TaxID=13708 RepID=A0AAD8KV13_TARER|nr:hypothetical protein QVD17_12625 [Tagetes erecta]